MPTNHIRQCHIFMLFEHLQGQWSQLLSGQPVPTHHQLFAWICDSEKLRGWKALQLFIFLETRKRQKKCSECLFFCYCPSRCLLQVCEQAFLNLGNKSMLFCMPDLISKVRILDDRRNFFSNKSVTDLPSWVRRPETDLNVVVYMCCLAHKALHARSFLQLTETFSVKK